MSNLTELIFAKGVYVATKLLIHGNLPLYKFDDEAIKDSFTYILRAQGYHEIRINELYEQCKSS